MELEVQIAGEDDEVHDPSSVWPDERERVDRRHARDHGDRSRRRRRRSSWTRCASSTGSSPPATRCCLPPAGLRPLARSAEPPGSVTSLTPMRVGLVLGAGGVQGGAWLTGGLDALADETGWDPATADVVVGTSAGSMIGSLCVAGIPPWFMVAHSAGETFEGVVDAQRPPRRRGRPRGRRAVPARARLAADRPRLVARWRCAPCARRTATRPAAVVRRLGAARVHLHRAAEGHHPPRRPRAAGPTTPTTGSSPATTRPAAGSRSAAPAPRGRARRRRRRLLRDPRLLPPGRDRRAPLRRRRHLLDLEPRPRPRRAARPRDLPQPDLLPAPDRAPGTRSSGSRTRHARAPPAAGSAARRRSCAPAAPRSS